MAVGEYISVSSQRDAEAADIEAERQAQMNPESRAFELEELTQIYVERGLPYRLAREVAEVLTEKDVIRAHARDELGIDVDSLARPLQAALVSAVTFSCGAGIPLLGAAFVTDWKARTGVVIAATTLGLAGFGSLAAWLGGANKLRAAIRVLLGGWAAMGLTYGIGTLFETAAA
jgi:VIT1/CCC1 family predicted Fe2+/Mn2+ transporter